MIPAQLRRLADRADEAGHHRFARQLRVRAAEHEGAEELAMQPSSWGLPPARAGRHRGRTPNSDGYHIGTDGMVAE